MRSRCRWLIGLLVAFMVLAGTGAVSAQDGSAPVFGTPLPEPTTVPLFDVTLPADWVPAGVAQVQWYHGRWELGAHISLPTGSYASGINTPSLYDKTAVPGVNLTYIATGRLQLRVEAPILIARAGSDGLPGALEPLAAGTPVVLGQGDVAAFHSDAALHARTVGSFVVNVFSVLMWTGLAPETEQPAAVGVGLSNDYLGDLSADEWAQIPGGPLRIGVRRTLLPAEGVIGPYTVDPGAPELLAVEAGLMEVGLDYDDDGETDQWLTIEMFVPVNEVLRGVRTRLIRASEKTPGESFGIEPEDETRTPDPLVFLTLTFTPTDPQPLPTPNLAPTEPRSTVAPEGETPVTVTPGCEGTAEWLNAILDGISTIVADHTDVFAVTSGELPSLDPMLLRKTATDLRVLSDAQATTDVPGIAAAANDAIVAWTRDYAGAFDEIAQAVESGDQAGIGAVVDGFSVIQEGPLTGAGGEAISALAAACPELGGLTS